MRQNIERRTTNRGNGVVQNSSRKTKKGIKSKKFKNTRLFKLLKILLIIVVIIILINIIKGLFHRSPKNVTLIIGDEKAKLVHNIEIDKNKNIFISIDDMKNLYDKNIYYSNNILITTYNKHIAVLEKGKTTMKVNDVVQEIKGTLKTINGTTYLPFSDLYDVYDFESNYNEKTKVLSVDSKSKEKKESVVLKTIKVKEEPKLFSKTVEKVKKAQYVTVFETKGKYTKIRTKDGNIGYVKTKRLSDPEYLWEDMDDSSIDKLTVLNDFSTVSSSYEVPEKLGKNPVVVPTLFRIVENSSGQVDVEKVMSFENDTLINYRNWAEGNGITLCPEVTLDCKMSKVCSNYETRSLVINTLYNELVNNRLTMVCIDFTEIDDIEGLYRFITELVPRFKCAGMKVIVKYNSFLNKDRLNNIVDYVID